MSDINVMLLEIQQQAMHQYEARKDGMDNILEEMEKSINKMNKIQHYEESLKENQPNSVIEEVSKEEIDEEGNRVTKIGESQIIYTDKYQLGIDEQPGIQVEFVNDLNAPKKQVYRKIERKRTETSTDSTNLTNPYSVDCIF